MAHSKSAQKSLRVAQRQALENRGIRSSVRTYFRKAQQSVAHAAEDAPDLVRLAVSQLDKAATKNPQALAAIKQSLPRSCCSPHPMLPVRRLGGPTHGATVFSAPSHA